MTHAITNNEPLGNKTPGNSKVHDRFVGHPVTYVVLAAPYSNFGKDLSYCSCRPCNHNIRLDRMPNTTSLACYPSEVGNAVVRVRTSDTSIRSQG
jgi:hypothetical protein